MAVYTVRLKSGTTGTIDSDTLNGQHAESFIGEVVDIHCIDENGNSFGERGRLVEVLEENEY